MISSSKLTHALTNDVEAILVALECIEIKLKSKDLKGALHTLGLIQNKKLAALETLNQIKTHLTEKEK